MAKLIMNSRGFKKAKKNSQSQREQLQDQKCQNSTNKNTPEFMQDEKLLHAMVRAGF